MPSIRSRDGGPPKSRPPRRDDPTRPPRDGSSGGGPPRDRTTGGRPPRRDRGAAPTEESTGGEGSRPARDAGGGGPRHGGRPSGGTEGSTDRRTSGQRRTTPRGGTPRGQRPGEGKREFGGGQEKARARERARDGIRTESPVLARTGREVVYGRNGVWEALRGRRDPHRLWLAEGVKEDERLRAILAAAERRGAVVERIPRMMLDDALPGANHQGIALEADAFAYAEFGEIVAASGTVLVLDHLQDPQNFGTLLRTAEAAGVAGVVIPEDRAVAVTPGVVNASAGAVEHLRIASVPNLPRAIESLKGSGWWVVGLHGGDGSVPIYEADLPTPAVLVVGAEGSGLGQRVRSVCDVLVSLPMAGQVGSLNAATAGAIALYELVRREADAADETGEDEDENEEEARDHGTEDAESEA